MENTTQRHARDLLDPPPPDHPNSKRLERMQTKLAAAIDVMTG